MKGKSKSGGQASSLPVNPLAPIKEVRRGAESLSHIDVAGATYFVTFRVAEGMGGLTLAERDLVAGAIRFHDDKLYTVHAWVVMDDHVHLLVTPAAPDFDTALPIGRVLHAIKSFTANRINEQRGRTGRFWQSEGFDSIVDGDREFENRWSYILNNPYRRWPNLVWGEYKWIGDRYGLHETKDIEVKSMAGKMPAPLDAKGSAEVERRSQ